MSAEYTANNKRSRETITTPAKHPRVDFHSSSAVLGQNNLQPSPTLMPTTTPPLSVMTINQDLQRKINRDLDAGNEPNADDLMKLLQQKNEYLQTIQKRENHKDQIINKLREYIHHHHVGAYRKSIHQEVVSDLRCGNCSFGMLTGKMFSRTCNFNYFRYKPELLAENNPDGEVVRRAFITSNCSISYDIEVTRIFRLNSNRQKPPKDTTAGQNGNLLLWHGTKTNCVSSILTTGLQVINTNIVNGRKFGHGVYFADVAVTATMYSCNKFLGHDKDYMHYVFVCEISDSTTMTEVPNQTGPFDYINYPGCEFFKFPGVLSPAECSKLRDSNNNYFNDYIRYSCVTNQDEWNTVFGYNEYLVLNTKLIIPRYLVQFRVSNL